MTFSKIRFKRLYGYQLFFFKKNLMVKHIDLIQQFFERASEEKKKAKQRFLITQINKDFKDDKYFKYFF